MSLESLIRQSKSDPQSWQWTSLREVEHWFLTKAKPGLAMGVPQALSAERMVFVNGFLDRKATTLRMVQKRGAWDLAPRKNTGVVELLFLYDKKQTAQTYTRLDFRLGFNSGLILLERHKNTGAKRALHERDLTITLGEGSRLVHACVVDEGQKTFHHAQTNVTVMQGAAYKALALLRGGLIARQAFDIDLCELWAQASVSSLLLGARQSHHDITTHIKHAAEYTQSEQICRAVLSDSACGVFKGVTHLDSIAQKAQGHQSGRALLLSDDAAFDSRPELEIFADDVQCSHGITTSALDENALFYLRARGVPEAKARALLTRAFMQSFLEDEKVPIVKNMMQEEITSWTF